MKTRFAKLFSISFAFITLAFCLCACSNIDGGPSHQLIYSVEGNTNPKDILVNMDMSDFNCQYIDVYVGMEGGELTLTPNGGSIVNNEQFDTSKYYLNNFWCLNTDWYRLKEYCGVLHFTFPATEDTSYHETTYSMGAPYSTSVMLTLHRNAPEDQK